MDLGFNLAQSNRDLKDPTSRQIFGDTSGLLCKNDPILRPNSLIMTFTHFYGPLNILINQLILREVVVLRSG